MTFCFLQSTRLGLADTQRCQLSQSRGVEVTVIFSRSFLQ